MSPPLIWSLLLKFSLISLVGFVLIAGLTFAALAGGMVPFAILRLAALIAFLAAILIAVYSSLPEKSFAGGWAICSGVSLLLIFAGVPITGAFLLYSPDPAHGAIVDLAFSFVLAYFGGTLSSRLASNQGPADGG